MATTAKRPRLLYALATLGPTAAIDSGDLYLADVDEIMVVVFNGNTTLTRGISFKFKTADGVLMDTITPTAVPANTTQRFSFGKGASATGVTAGYAITPPPKFQLSAAAPASGTGNGAIYIWGR
jgi:hypothetical protein